MLTFCDTFEAYAWICPDVAPLPPKVVPQEFFTASAENFSPSQESATEGSKDCPHIQSHIWSLPHEKRVQTTNDDYAVATAAWAPMMRLGVMRRILALKSVQTQQGAVDLCNCDQTRAAKTKDGG